MISGNKKNNVGRSARRGLGGLLPLPPLYIDIYDTAIRAPILRSKFLGKISRISRNTQKSI
jgi:hypothetical protein